MLRLYPLYIIWNANKISGLVDDDEKDLRRSIILSQPSYMRYRQPFRARVSKYPIHLQQSYLYFRPFDENSGCLLSLSWRD